jgi:hypothetical protein
VLFVYTCFELLNRAERWTYRQYHQWMNVVRGMADVMETLHEVKNHFTSVD